MKKVFIVGGGKYANFLEDINIVENVEEADIVLFGGSEDVTPSFYKDKKLSCTRNNYQRDLKERALFKKLNANQFCIGIGRGAQFLAVLNGCKLIQDIPEHDRKDTHLIVIENNLVLDITSLHHQSIDANTINGKILAQTLSLDYHKNPIAIPEIVYFEQENHPRCLCIQGHPEYMIGSPICKWINRKIKELC